MLTLPRSLHSPLRSLLPAGCLLLLAAATVALHSFPTAGLQGYQQRARPELVLGQDKITSRNAAFLRAGLLRMSHTFSPAEKLAASSPAAVGFYGQECPAPDAARLQQDLPPSTALLPPVAEIARQDMAVISIVCKSDHLFDPAHGIVTNPFERGKPSERPAWLSARVGSRVVVESPIGLRVHGGASRGLPMKSFSILFRESYGGHALCPPGLFFGPDTPAANHLVLLNADHPSRFNGALGTEIAGRLGCHVSRFLPAVVYVNGTMIKAPYFLYQYQSPEFIQDRLGLADVDWKRLKGIQKRSSDDFIKWRRWLRKDRNTQSMQEEARYYDLEDLSAWALTMTFTATSDCNQGGYFRDRTDEKAPWRSLVWDMDFAFNDDLMIMQDGSHFVYARDPLKVLVGERARLFFRLFERAEDYRTYFQRFAEERLATRLPQQDLMAMVDRYIELARTHPASRPEIVQALQETRTFLSTRREEFLPYLRQQIKEVEQTGEFAQRGPPPVGEL